MNAFKKIKQARQELGLTQIDLAKALGLSQNAVSKLESGQKKFIPNKYILFLQEKGYDINTIFNDEVALGKLYSQQETENPQGDEALLKNKIVRLLGLPNQTALEELLKQMDTSGTLSEHPFEKLVLLAWEKKYLSQFNSMVRQMEIYEEEVFELAPERIAEVRKNMNLENKNNTTGTD